MRFEDEYCDWYFAIDYRSIEEGVDILDQSRRVSAYPWFFCKNNGKDQHVDIGYVGCIPIDQIKYEEYWNASRKENIREWGSKSRLSRAFYRDTRNDDGIIDRHNIPSLSRSYEYDSKLDYTINGKTLTQVLGDTEMSIDAKKEWIEKFNALPHTYDIGDGIHRINRARELGMECIVADAMDDIIIKQSKIKNFQF